MSEKGQGMFSKIYDVAMSKLTVERAYADEPSPRGRSARSQLDPSNSVPRTTPYVNQLGFMKDAIVLGTSNMFQALAFDAGYKVYSDYAPTQAGLDFFHEVLLEDRYWFKRTMLQYNPIHICIDGNCFLENLMGSIENVENKKLIVGVSVADFRTMDFIRDGGDGLSGDVKFDRYNRPIGYIQTGPDGEIIKFTRDQMQHNTMNQTHPGERGIGFVEALIDIITLKLNAIHAEAEIAAAQADPIPVVIHGDALKRCSAETRQVAQRVRDDIIDEGVDGIEHPNYIKIDQWPPRTDYKVPEKFYDTLIEMQACVLGAPVALVTQNIASMSQQSLELLMDHFQFRFRAFQRDLGIEEWYYHMLSYNGWPTKGLKCEYGELSDRMFKEESLRFLRMAKSGVLDPEDSAVKAKAHKIAGITPSRGL